MEDFVKDSRFSSVGRDPRFKRMPTNEQKTKIDKRFCAMFKDKNFQLKYVMDKRGRPINNSTFEDLKKFYELSSSESDDENSQEKSVENLSLTDKNKESNKKRHLKTHKLRNKIELDEKALSAAKYFTADQKHEIKQDKVVPIVSDVGIINKSCVSEGNGNDVNILKPRHKSESEDSETDKDSNDELSDKLDLSKYHYESEDSETDEDSDDEPHNEFDHKWEELDADAPVASEISTRIAVCNMDWDRIRAEDIFAVFNSFKPANGVIHSVKIYPSEFGLKRMEEEKLRGPTELVERTLNSDEEDDNEDNEGSRYHREKLRQYQINRLKYYYAVVDCDSTETADCLYEQLNGMEYESSAVSMDLRFIPNEVTFDQEPTVIALSPPIGSEYKPRLFITSALQQVKVNLTWDETDPKRRETIQKAFTESESIDKDIKSYLASSSSSSGSESETVCNQTDDGNFNSKMKLKDQIASYRSLLLSVEEKEKKDEEEYEMEITWEPGLKEKTEEMVNEKLERNTLTPFEEKLRKKREERKMKKKEKKDENEEHSASEENVDFDLVHNSKKDNYFFKHHVVQEDRKKVAELSLMMSDSKVNSCFENVKNKKKKKPEDSKNDDFKIDINDERFSAIYTSHLFNIDPSDPHYKETGTMQAIIQEKQKKRKLQTSNFDSVDEAGHKCSRISNDALNLVNSLKRKANLKQRKHL